MTNHLCAPYPNCPVCDGKAARERPGFAVSTVALAAMAIAGVAILVAMVLVSR